MPPKKRKRTGGGGGGGGSLANEQNKTWLLSSLNAGYKGKRVMLHAKDIYTGRIPSGEEDYYFQYHIIKINDEATATLSFDNKYVKEGGTVISNYVGRTEDDRLVSYEYKSHFNRDHKLYNYYNNIANAESNEKKFAALKAEEEAKKSAIEDTSDLSRKLEGLDSAGASESKQAMYDLLLEEFEPVGELVNHEVQKGAGHGTSHMKQVWGHKHSPLRFTWHHKVKKAEFDKSVLWKQARIVVSKRFKGYERVDFILKAGKMEGAELNPDLEKNERTVDMPLRVAAVIGAVASKQPLSVFDNLFMRDYIHKLNPKHSIPYRLERNRIIEVLIDIAMAEVRQILTERRDELGEAFASANIDFWTDKHRKEGFGVIVIDVLAEKYEVTIGDSTMSLFMSRKTRARLGAEAIASKSVLCVFVYFATKSFLH